MAKELLQFRNTFFLVHGSCGEEAKSFSIALEPTGLGKRGGSLFVCDVGCSFPPPRPEACPMKRIAKLLTDRKCFKDLS